jgi:hypothetical protein
LDYAWHNLEKTWEAVKNADEIYAETALLPLSGGSYSGAPVIFDGMCERAIKEKVKGKDVYILRDVTDVEWDQIDLDLMVKAFKHNRLFAYGDEAYETLIQVDVKEIAKKHK